MVLSIGNLFIDLRPTFVLSLRQYHDSYDHDDHHDDHNGDGDDDDYVDANVYS